ncbi:MAG: vitamin K epoxide reductase family protein [Deltaproteobacteria bacterium]
MKRWIPLLLILAVTWGCFFAVKSAMAKDHIVYAALFYSPTCSHCAKLEREFLPTIEGKYGNKLVIVRLNVISAAGNKMYEKALERFKITENRIGVPTLIIGETFLVGTVEIPEKLPELIDAAISKGGLDLPEIPGLYEQFLVQSNIKLEKLSTWQFMAYKFKQDPLANGIAVSVLLIMIFSLIAALIITLSSVNVPKALTILPGWIIPPLALTGLAIAVYLSYVEVSETRAVCGPVGNCNAVQNSPYAKLFGILPIAVMGMIVYVAIILAWLFRQFGPALFKRIAGLVIFGLAIFSVLFSAYLTFLEPFVIGASCAFCLASAIVVTIILWVSMLPAREVLRQNGQG